jgi:Sec-independent protein secretion pathway component TatC
MAKLLIIAGIVLFLVGVLFSYNISIPYLGKLPGDISVKGDNYQVYFPVMTCIIISIVLSFILYLFRK